MTTLRDYQQEIVVRVQKEWQHHRSVMVQMPTGTGKTHVLAAMVKEQVAMGADCVLIVAHRVELVEQIKATVDGFKSLAGNPSWLRNTQHAASLHGNQKSDIRVSSIQSISRRVDSLDFTPHLIIIDEAHHALAKTYRILWEKWPEAKFLGLTATPYRLNGEGFTDLFDSLVTSWSLAEFIKKGVLSSFDYVPVRPDAKERLLIGSLKKRGVDGDYQVKEMDAVLNQRPCIERLYESVKEHAAGKKGIVYAISIGHARNIAQYYSEQGMRSAAIDSRTPKVERKRLVEAFKNGELEVLVNVDIFSEGFDCPDVEFIQMARPTLSLSKYLQQVGRGLRKSKGKGNCLLIDNVGLCRTFGLPTQDWDWEGMFEGSREAEPWQDAETQLWGLRRGQKILTEAVYVRIFDVQGGKAAVRFRNYEGGLVDETGQVLWKAPKVVSLKMTPNQLLVAELEGGKQRYVDLCNLKVYADKPEVKRYGNFELLKVKHRCYSRTQEVYVSQKDFVDLGVIDRGFYLSILEVNVGHFCLLAGDKERCYRFCRRMTDGSIVVEDGGGSHYHVTEKQKIVKAVTEK